jgi:hypothetical protein
VGTAQVGCVRVTTGVDGNGFAVTTTCAVAATVHGAVANTV